MKFAPFAVAAAIATVAFATTAPSAAAATTDASPSDCTAPMVDRVNAAAQAAQDDGSAELRGTAEESVRETYRRVRICAGESIQFGDARPIGPKAAGTSIPSDIEVIESVREVSSSKIAGKGRYSGRSFSCDYAAVTPAYFGGSNTIVGQGQLKCTSAVNMDNNVCVGKYFHASGASGLYHCQGWFTPSPQPANTWWLRTSAGAPCNTTTSFRSQTNPRRFYGGWSGPGWIWTSYFTGATWC